MGGNTERNGKRNKRGKEKGRNRSRRPFSSLLRGTETASLLEPYGEVKPGHDHAIFGAEVGLANSFSLVGCMVTPGFHFDDFELLSFQDVKAAYPDYDALISKLT